MFLIISSTTTEVKLIRREVEVTEKGSTEVMNKMN